jgi:hypothetical protein
MLIEKYLTSALYKTVDNLRGKGKHQLSKLSLSHPVQN